jgi:NADH:ubiquinone oxidoreductase subunit
MATIGTRLFTWLKGKYVGSDELGNSYYEARRRNTEGVKKRWVIYPNLNEPSTVPPHWHLWLHYTTDEVPDNDNARPYFWQKPHRPNMTGTKERYLPPGHLDKGSNRDKSASGDYEAWRP